MRKVTLLAGMLGYVGMYLFVVFALTRLGVGERALYIASPLAACVIGAFLLTETPIDAAIATWLGGGLLLMLGLRGPVLIAVMIASGPCAMFGARLASQLPWRRARALPSVVLASAITVGVTFVVLIWFFNSGNPLLAVLIGM